MEETMAYCEALKKSGRLDGEQLEPIETAMSVRVRGGKLAVTDGPFAETKEQSEWLFHQRPGPERGDPGRFEVSVGAVRHHGSTASQGLPAAAAPPKD